jgi:hypothetical protein
MIAFTPLPFHPLAQIFPLIEGDDFDDLIEDIRANGVRDPIILHEGQVLDGRNRYRALLALKVTGELRGDGWGSLAREAVTDEDLDPAGGLSWFERYSPMLNGDPLQFVVSKNLRRRHLNASQRAMLAADLGKLGWGGDRSKSSREGLTISQRAELARVGHASIERADTVKERGVPELQDAVRKGDLGVKPAAEIAQREPDAQREELVERGVLPASARAIAPTRVEPDDSLDFFPTPPWPTRALIEHVFPQIGARSRGIAAEPACGEGHIAEVLREYFPQVRASDVFDYAYDGQRVHDFLGDAPLPHGEVDWIITNPPFGLRAEKFVLRALELARVGVAMFLRLQWLEGVGRYNAIFQPYPPTIIAQFVERVPLHKGRWEPEGDTLTAYIWIVWLKGNSSPTRMFWIPPGRREALTKPDDAVRFTAHPVMAKQHAQFPIPAEIGAAPSSQADHDERGEQPTAVDVTRADDAAGEEPAAADVPCVGSAGSSTSEDDMLEIPKFLRRPQPEPAKVE